MSKKPYVITGGPGVGKTTLVTLLKERGYTVVPECARIILEQESKKDSEVLPWKNAERFQEEVAKLQLQLESRPLKDVTFLDRGLVDGFAYNRLRRIPNSNLLLNNLKDRYEMIFLLEPLEFQEINELRPEDRNLALEIHEEIWKSYLLWGYKIVSVPALPIEKRAEFILNHIL